MKSCRTLNTTQKSVIDSRLPGRLHRQLSLMTKRRCRLRPDATSISDLIDWPQAALCSLLQSDPAHGGSPSPPRCVFFMWNLVFVFAALLNTWNIHNVMKCLF